MKQLQIGSFDRPTFERINKVVKVLSKRSGFSLSRKQVFLIMLKDAEEKYEIETRRN